MTIEDMGRTMGRMTTVLQHESLDAAIGERVHGLMWRRRVTQVEFAARLRVTQPTLSRKLRGARPWTADEIAAAATELDVPIEYLFYGETPPAGQRAGKWAPRGSNPEPTGYRHLRLAA